jgi:hypothetical protein
MSDINLEYSSPQDKLLIMLLERITALEDVISKQSATLSELVSMSTSDVFTVYMTGKYQQVLGSGYEDITKVEDKIMSIINSIVPCHNIYGHFNYDNTGGSLAIHTQEKHLLLNIQTMLNGKLSTLVNLNSWQMKSPMDILKNTECMKNYRLLGEKTINSDTQ